MNWLMGLLLLTSPVLADTILGAGATFPYPLYSKMFQEYSLEKPKFQFNYQPVGSGGGVKQLSDGLVDFGASDVLLSDQEKKLFKTSVLEIPMTIGGIVVAYKIQGLEGLKISRGVLGQIFSGKITTWNHEAIKKENPELKLPSSLIKVVTRADASGTTAVMTDFLSLISSEFKSKVGTGKAVKWPMMVAKGKGNDGVTAIIKATEGSIGYVEMAYAINQNLTIAQIENKSGKYIKPSLESFSKAAEVSKFGHYDILDSSISEAYPITSFTFILLPKLARSEEIKKEVKNFLKWGLSTGQKFSTSLHYSSLPQNLAKELISKVDTF